MPELPINADPVPATPIGELASWQLHIECGRCRNRTVLALNYLAEQYGRRTAVVDVVRRLRCGGFRGPGKCRSRPRLVILVKVSTHGKTTRKLRQITVLETSQSRPPLATSQQE